MKHFETKLPEGYVPVYEIDAKNRKTAVFMNLAGLLVLILVLLLFVLTIGYRNLFRMYDRGQPLLTTCIYIGGMILYIILHELVHGAVYKLLTHQKLTFGLSFSCAYCGVPGIYVYRTASLLATLAPFAVFTVVFLLLALFVRMPALRLSFVLLFCMHICGCVGDLYGAILMLFRFRNPKLLVRDTGPKQTYYLPQ